MASFSASSSAISLLLCTMLFAAPIKSYPLDNICRQTKRPNFCLNLLKPHSSSSLQELDQIVIDATLSSVTKTSAKIQSLLSQTSDPDLRVVYSLCSNYYSAALSALTAAKEKLKSRDYGDVKSASGTVSMDASSCQKAFAIAPPHSVIPIAGDNNDFDLLSDVFVVVSRILSGSV